MALHDILERIASDAKAEAGEVVSQAQAEADASLAHAREQAEGLRETIVGRARIDAERDAATGVANARLRARDSALRARQALADEVLSRVEDGIAALPTEQYTALLAAELRVSASGGESLALGHADAVRIREPLAERLAAEGVHATFSDQPAEIPHGVVLTGDRMRVEISPASIVAMNRDRLLPQADSMLFPDEGRG